MHMLSSVGTCVCLCGVHVGMLRPIVFFSTDQLNVFPQKKGVNLGSSEETRQANKARSSKDPGTPKT